MLVVFQSKQKLTRALGQNPELFLGSEFYEQRLFATFSIPLNLRCYVTPGSEGTFVGSSCINSQLICSMPILSVLRLPTNFFIPNEVSKIKYGILNRKTVQQLSAFFEFFMNNHNSNVLHTYWKLPLNFVNIGLYSPFNNSWIYQRFSPNESLY